MKRIIPAFTVFITLFSCSLSAQSSTFVYTGVVQTYTVPACVTSITVDAKGAAGGATGASTGGLGGRVQATLAVTPGEVLNIYVGGVGLGVSGAAGGWNGGGATGAGTGGSGGGATDIRMGGTALTNRVLVASGGGGTGTAQFVNNHGGGGGGLTGQNGVTGGSYNSSDCGAGGTQTAGGTNASTSGATAGSLGQGGNGGAHGGGGGGGYYGGGGGAGAIVCCTGGGGGGGSSYIIPAATSVTHTPATQAGDGQIIINAVPSTGPPAPGAITGVASICSNSSDTFSIASVPGASSYTWTVSSGSSVVNGQGTTAAEILFGNTSATISVTATNTCGTSSASTFSVSIIPAVNPVITATMTEFCLGDSVELIASAANSYLWSTGDTTQSIWANASATYDVTSPDANGCLGTSSVTITALNNPVFYLGQDTMICDTSEVLLIPGTYEFYNWHDGSTASTFLFDAANYSLGIYSVYVQVIDSNECAGTDTIQIETVICENIHSENQENSLTITPNPADGFITLQFGKQTQTIIAEILNLHGQIVEQKTLNTTSKSQYVLDLSSLSTGVYYIRITTGETIIVQKIVVQ